MMEVASNYMFRPLWWPYTVLCTTWRWPPQRPKHVVASYLLHIPNTLNIVVFWLLDITLYARLHVSYRTLEVRRLSAQQFDTLYRMPEQIVFTYLGFIYNPALEGNCPRSHNLSIDTYLETVSELVLAKKKKKKKKKILLLLLLLLWSVKNSLASFCRK